MTCPRGSQASLTGDGSRLSLPLSKALMRRDLPLQLTSHELCSLESTRTPRLLCSATDSNICCRWCHVCHRWLALCADLSTHSFLVTRLQQVKGHRTIAHKYLAEMYSSVIQLNVFQGFRVLSAGGGYHMECSVLEATIAVVACADIFKRGPCHRSLFCYFLESSLFVRLLPPACES